MGLLHKINYNVGVGIFYPIKERGIKGGSTLVQ